MEDVPNMSPSLTDQLSLPVDVFGKLLLLLPDEDIQRVRLVCQAWLAAVDHQMRVLQPLHLPQQPSTAVFSSCERVQAPVLRHAGQTSTQHADAEFCWDAPIRHFDGMCVSMQHAAELDLSGQQLPPGCLRQLAQHMTRLRCLKLEASSLSTAAELCNLAAFAAQAAGSGAGGGGLSQLSLAGLQITTSPAAGNVRVGQSPAAAALAAAAARLAGSSSCSSSSSSVGVPEMLSAIATNPLTHLDLSRTAKDTELLTAAGHISAAAQPQAQQQAQQIMPPLVLPVLGRCSQLGRLCSSLLSLKLTGNSFNADDWQHLCSRLTLLTELHMSWDSETADLGLNAGAFQGISKLQRLQSLTVNFRQDPRGLAYEPYTLAPLARTLTAAHLSGTNSLSLLLSLTECSGVRQLTLQRITGAAGTPELVVQVLRCMPLLQELCLEDIQSPVLERVGLCHMGDYVLSQLDCCCPHLTKLVMTDVDLNGTGIRLAATTPVLASPDVSPAAQGSHVPSAAATAGSSSRCAAGAGAGAGLSANAGLPGSGALRRLQHLELNAACLMSSALPHLSCLTALHSLTLWHMKPSQFTHACRFDCFRFASALTNLTSLSMPQTEYSAPAWSAAAEAAVALGAGGANGVAAFDEGDDLDIDLLQPFGQLQQGPGGAGGAAAGGAAGGPGGAAAGGGAGDGEDDEDEDEGDFVDTDSDSSGSDAGSDGDGVSSGSDEWEDADEGGYPEAAPPAVLQQQQQQQQAAGGAGQQVDPVEQMMHQAEAVLGQQQDALAALAMAMQPLQAAQGGAAVLQAAEALGQLQEALADPAAQAHNPVLAHAVQQLAQALAAQAGAEQAGPAAQHLAQVLIAQAQAGAAGAWQGPPAGAQQQQLSAVRRVASRTMEPHLHFLARLQGLVTLNLGCLNSKGPCLMHLNSLQHLQTLVLSRGISLSETSLELLAKLRLPSVQHLSITGCRFESNFVNIRHLLLEAVAAKQGAPAGSRTGGSSNGSGGGSSSSGAASGRPKRGSAYEMDRFVQEVLPAAFPNCQDLRLGSCARLTIIGLAALLQTLPKLQRLWLVGCSRSARSCGSVPFNFVVAGGTRTAAAAAAAGQQHRSMQVSVSEDEPQRQQPDKQQQQEREQQVGPGGAQLVVGHVLPYDPSAYGVLDSRPQRGAELAWFVEHGIVVQPELYAHFPSSHQAAAAAAEPGTSSVAAAATGDVPASAVAVPCVAGSQVKYVCISESQGPGRRFTRCKGRMVPV